MRSAAALASSSHVGTGTAMQTPAGSVSAFFALEGFDRRRGVAIYALRVVNRTSSALICRTWVVSRAGDAVLAYPLSFEVAPLSTSATQVPVWPGDFASFDRAIAEIIGDGVQCIVEAPVPANVKPQRGYARVAVATVAAGLVALGLTVALRAAAPHITALAVPPEALAGTTLRAEYDAAGAGALSYAVTAPDGRRLQGGNLDDRSGSIPIALPPASAPGAFVLEMTIAGPLGSTTQTRVVNAIVGKAASAAQIAAISVKPVVAKPGQTVTVAYSALGQDGYVRLEGGDGTIWQQRPFSRNGETELLIPPVSSSREMRVVLHVTEGRSAAESVAGLVVEPTTLQRADAAAQIAGDDDPGSNVTSADNGTFEVLTPTVKSGGTIRVHILSPRNGMRISLTDTQSREITGVSPGVDADEITLQAPIVSAPTRYTVVASFTDGFGQESIVQPVTVAP
jgi:hypothetical protein